MSGLWQQIVALCRRHPVAVAGFALFVLFGGANYYLWEHHSTLESEHARIRAQGEEVLQVLSGHSIVQGRLATLQDAVATIDKNLVAEPDLAGNLDYFYQFERSARVRVSNLSQLSSMAVPEGTRYKTVPFSMQVEGSYERVLNFVHALETGPRLSVIKSFAFARTDPAADRISLNLTVELLARP